MIPDLRSRFNLGFDPRKYTLLLANLEQSCGSRVEFRVAETHVFLSLPLLDGMAAAGAEMARMIMGNPACLDAERPPIHTFSPLTLP